VSEQSETVNVDARLARVLLPARLLREVDELVLSGRGGYSSRQEFMLEAIQNHVLEVRHGPTERGQLLIDGEMAPQRVDGPRATSSGGSGNGRTHETVKQTGAIDEVDAPALPAALGDDVPVEPVGDIKETALRAPVRGATLESGIARFKKEPLIGLHNRDYPSIWAVRLLAEMTASDLIPVSRFLEEATAQAWRFARSLLDLERQSKVKLTALFPTNISKPQSAEDGFRAFAIGTIARKPGTDGCFETSGPLFSWQICQLALAGDTLRIGLTDAGWGLVEALDGLTLAWPHERVSAERFFAHLSRHAPWDWQGFEQVVDAVASHPTRVELMSQFQRWQPEWSDAVANTTSSGFIARGREWGLITPKLVDGRYALTDFGNAMLQDRRAA
jgi:hypothetical protein